MPATALRKAGQHIDANIDAAPVEPTHNEKEAASNMSSIEAEVGSHSFKAKASSVRNPHAFALPTRFSYEGQTNLADNRKALKGKHSSFENELLNLSYWEDEGVFSGDEDDWETLEQESEMGDLMSRICNDNGKGSIARSSRNKRTSRRGKKYGGC